MVTLIRGATLLQRHGVLILIPDLICGLVRLDRLRLRGPEHSSLQNVDFQEFRILQLNLARLFDYSKYCSVYYMKRFWLQQPLNSHDDQIHVNDFVGMLVEDVISCLLVFCYNHSQENILAGQQMPRHNTATDMIQQPIRHVLATRHPEHMSDWLMLRGTDIKTPKRKSTNNVRNIHMA